jgi:hypothetical protein
MLVRSTALKESTDARPGLLIFRNYESVEHARALPKGEGIRLASHSRLLNSDWQREDQLRKPALDLSDVVRQECTLVDYRSYCSGVH